MANFENGSNQSLNAYVEMLHTIYGSTQNYAKTKAEIYQHLSEVCGIAGKHLFKKTDLEAATRFIPKIFGWACALVSAVNPSQTSAEEMILRKFPVACPYCTSRPCSCWSSGKPTLDEKALEALYYQNAPRQARGVNDFELMFSEIYSSSWRGPQSDQDPLTYIYLRLIEELAEVSEALRFQHIYPQNFQNEIADFFGWWFALASAIKERKGDGSLTSDLLWRAYPGYCLDCETSPCFCAQGPVRELMSKPAPGALGETDRLTSLRNQGAYERDLEVIGSGKLKLAMPAACVRMDVDDFKNVNSSFGHPGGDAALKHIAAIVRQKCRPRDRIYRISGDEFGVLMPDTSEDEAFGVMTRVLNTIRGSQVLWTSKEGVSTPISVSLSIGVAECCDSASISTAFEAADAASYASKDAGKAAVSRASSITTLA